MLDYNDVLPGKQQMSSPTNRTFTQNDSLRNQLESQVRHLKLECKALLRRQELEFAQERESLRAQIEAIQNEKVVGASDNDIPKVEVIEEKKKRKSHKKYLGEQERIFLETEVHRLMEENQDLHSQNEDLRSELETLRT